jgi:RNA polymerase sigma factor (sigma-70 family)
MASVQAGVVLREIHGLLGEDTHGGASDKLFLDRYLARRDQAAFTALVERHGPMVLATCRGVLKDPYAADDAFQNTFLTLVRKAASIKEPGALGGWLHRVAVRTATRAAIRANRDRVQERQAGQRADAIKAEHEVLPGDLRQVLHDEIDRLPKQFRTPIVLCDLEGRTYEEAARQLGWPVGTIKSRLSRGRKQLEARLRRRGLAPAVGVAAVLAAEAASAAVPAGLIVPVIKAAMQSAASQAATGVICTSAAQVGKILHGFILANLKAGSVGLLKAGSMVLLVAGVGIGVGVVVKGGSSVPGGATPTYEGVGQQTSSGSDEQKTESRVVGNTTPRPQYTPGSDSSHPSYPSSAPASGGDFRAASQPTYVPGSPPPRSASPNQTLSSGGDRRTQGQPTYVPGSEPRQQGESRPDDAKAVIVSPKDGGTVSHNEDLEGRIRGRGWPVVLIRPHGAQPWWVQPSVDDVINGKFSCPVYFGNETSPDGMRFKVVILVARDRSEARSFSAGSTLQTLPPNLPSSEPITVTLSLK